MKRLVTSPRHLQQKSFKIPRVSYHILPERNGAENGMKHGKREKVGKSEENAGYEETNRTPENKANRGFAVVPQDTALWPSSPAITYPFSRVRSSDTKQKQTDKN